MRNNETVEFELLVGNRQLLSGFFIVVLLFAVAFSMGYIVGRDSSPSAKLQTETGSSPGTQSQAPESPPQPGSPPGAAGGPPGAMPPQPAGALPADTPPQPSTQPERGSQSASATAAGTAPPVAPPAPPPPPEAAPGSYWQGLATARPTPAHALRHTNQEKGLPAPF